MARRHNQLRSSLTDTETAPANELNPVMNDDALIVHYQDKFYLVDPAPKPEQPFILVNKGGNLNGVFLNAQIEHDGIIYEVDEKKTNNKVRNNEVRNEPFTLINLNSVYSYKGSLSEEEEKVCSVKPLVVKEKGCRTDSELEWFGVIKYKTISNGKKNKTPPHVMKDDTPVTKPTEPASVTKDRDNEDSEKVPTEKPTEDDTPVTKPTEPASVTKDDTPTDAKRNGAPAPVRSSLTDSATAPVNELQRVYNNEHGDGNTFLYTVQGRYSTVPEQLTARHRTVNIGSREQPGVAQS